MLWYLLYPIRGTSDPPRLPAEHPVRRAFYRHGTTTARHWLLSMLVSVTVGVILTYPTVFMSDFPSTGISGLPQHVWTGTSSLQSKQDKQPDVEMRQVWIHGSYMEALNKSTLREALKLQNAILGDASTISSNFHEYPEDAGWGYHSPLMYWNNSLALLESDANVINTVNAELHERSFLNFTIHPMSVFAGKSYRASQLISADALVITMINRNNDTFGAIWQDNIVKLANQPSKSWSQSLGDEEIGQSRVFEYRFQPLSFRQNSALAIAYGFMILYVVASLRRLKAFRSRVGLVVTAITQMTTSILASFTICGLLKINLAQIPQEAYPFVVLTIGLENIFRLINAVLAYPPEMLTTQRIANGLGDIGHSSLASAAQNLAILWILSLVVSPGVSAFCAFAAVALLFDYFFLITFFVAVLNVDIQRLELQDSIVRSRSPNPKAKKMDRRTWPDRPSWIDAIMRGRVPFSTRMAGSAVTISFVLALNWHFSDHSIADLRSRSWAAVTSGYQLPTADFNGPSSVGMNQTRHPSSWLKTRDYDNAVHFMNVVKPGGYSFSARVFDPFIIVLAGADRSGVLLAKDSWLSAIRNLAIHNFYPFALAVVFVVAFVTVLMNFLLWDARAEEEELESATVLPQLVQSSVVKTNHTLDIVKLAGDGNGNLLSIGLDRTISAALSTSTTKLSHVGIKLAIRWPINGCYIFDRHMAILCGDGQLLVRDVIDDDSASPIEQLSLGQDDIPLLIHRVSGSEHESLFILLPEGTLMELDMMHRQSTTFELINKSEELVTACGVESNGPKPDILGLTSSGQLFRATWSSQAGHWESSSFSDAGSALSFDADFILATSLQTVSETGLAVICSSGHLRMVEAASFRMSTQIKVSKARSQTVRMLHSKLEGCRVCGSLAANQVSFTFTEADSGDCVMITFSPQHEQTETGSAICFFPSGDGCISFQDAVRTDHRLQQPGAWEATSVMGIAGVRRQQPKSPSLLSPDTASQQEPILRKRQGLRHRELTPEQEEWEAYMFTSAGELHNCPLDVALETEGQLYVAEPGPVCRAGPISVAVALGNTLHVVQVCGQSTNESGSQTLKRTGSTAAHSRRRNAGRKSL